MLKVAIMGGALLLVALVLELAGAHYNDALLTVGFGTLAIVAFFLGQMFPGTHRVGAPIWKFAMTLTGYSLATTLIGLLFIILLPDAWPSAPSHGWCICFIIKRTKTFKYLKKKKTINYLKQQ